MSNDKEKGRVTMAEEKKQNAEKKEKARKRDRGAWFREMKSELQKVVWPNRETVMKNTGTVLLCSLIIGACIWIFDFAAQSVVKMILTVFGG